MKSILQSFQYLKGYGGRVSLNVLITILVAVLEIISLISVIPFLRLIFTNTSESKVVSHPGDFHLFPLDEAGKHLKQLSEYWLNAISQDYTKTQILTFICIGVASVFILKNLFIYLNQMIDRSIRYNVAKEVRQAIYEKILKLPIRYFSDQRRGDILTRFSNDVLKLEENVLVGFALIFKEPVMILFYLTSLFLISAKLTFFILILLPVLGFVIGRISKSLRRSSSAYQDKLGEMLSTIDETMFGAKVIKSFTAENYLLKRFNKENHRLKQINKKIQLRKTSASPVSETLGIIVVMIVLWYGGRLILGGGSNNLTGELLIGYLLIFSRMISPLKALSGLYSKLQDGLASADRIESFLALEEEYPELPQPTEQLHFTKNIVFDNVSFHYPGSEKGVLKNLNLTISKGSLTALVGQSGAGKSTIADLLPRFYDITQGQILIDGKNINQIPLEKLRGLFSYVSQEAIVFNDTVSNNIAFGLTDKTEEEIKEAAKIANAHEFISELEHGYQTNVGERGSKLSGGQKQRITIARAILKNAPILILDEATSALDTESERLVQDAIDRLLENRTALVIAHRLSTIKNADQICVMEQGEIIEKGKHNELLSIDSGHYRKLTEMQSL